MVKTMSKRIVMSCLLVTTVGLVSNLHAEGRQVIWAKQDLNFGPTQMPEGKLLTPHTSYWDPVVFSGVKISLDGKSLPADGQFKRKWLTGKQMTIEFPNPCTINELAVYVRGEKVITVKEPPIKTKTSKIPTQSKGYYWLRIKPVNAVKTSKIILSLPEGLKINAVQLWGDGPSQKVEPIYPVRKKFPVAYESLPGADKTSFSDHLYWSWRRELLKNPKFKDLGAVWAQQNKWTRISSAPILPEHEKLNKPVKIVMARNEFEGALLTLTSLKDRVGKEIHDSGIYKNFHPGSQEFNIKLSKVIGPTPKKVKLTLRIGGTLRSQLFGTVVGPFFSADNKLEPSRMIKYLTNGSTIADFPRIALNPCGSQVFWLDVQTEDAKPGTYSATLTAEPGPAIPITIEVLPVQLPTPHLWVHVWQGGTVGTSWPFYRLDVLQKTVTDKLSRGITSYYGFPEKYTEAYEAKKQRPDVTFFCRAIPNIWTHNGYCNLQDRYKNITEKQKKQFADFVHKTAERYKSLGVDYKHWFNELWDEPGDANANLIALAAKWVKQADPNVQVYVNPAFPDKVESFKLMSKSADLFVPFWGNWFKGPEWLTENNSSHVINAFYAVQGCNRSELNEELVGHYRIMAWQAYKINLQGWGFYSYFSPRGDPYTDYSPAGSEVDYQVVYPGPEGPIPSRQAQAFRDGWEDYRLLKYIETKGNAKAKTLLKNIVKTIPLGREPLTSHIDFEAIRLQLLRSAAKE